MKSARESLVQATRIVDEVVVAGEDYTIPKSVFEYASEDGSWYAQQRENVAEAGVLELTVSAPGTITADLDSSAQTADKIQFYVCNDASETTVYFKEIGPKPGSIGAGRLYVERVDNRWIVTDFVDDQPLQEVTKCDELR